MSENTNLKSLIEKADSLSTYNEMQRYSIFRAYHGYLYYHLLSRDFNIQTVDEFSLQCLAVLARQYDMVVVVDCQGDVWVGDEEEILKEDFFVDTCLVTKVHKIYR